MQACDDDAPEPVTGDLTPVPDAVRRALVALLAIDADTAAAVRLRTPSRRRPRPQDGPVAEFGDASPDG